MKKTKEKLWPRNQIYFEIFRRMRSHEDLLWRSSRDMIPQKIFAEFLRKIFWRFLEKRFYELCTVKRCGMPYQKKISRKNLVKNLNVAKNKKCSFLIREKAYGTWIKINPIFPQAGSYIALNALNEKLNLFWSMSHSP